MSEARPRSREHWYQNAIYYALDVDTFYDSDGNGSGDFRGLVQQLEYLSWLGVDCVWLLPFYPTPNRDNGYDITDHCAIKSSVGTLEDFDHFMRQAAERGIRVMLDLLMDHTSDQHPWFQQARRAPQSRYRDFYVWTDDPSRAPKHKQIFPEVEDSVWQWDELAHAYYLHHFYREEPDLNTANPAVRDEVRRIVHFWLDRGVAAFRIDGAPYVKGEADPLHDDPHPTLRWLRQQVTERSPEAMLCAEADVDPDKLAEYFSEGREMQVLFNFLLAEYCFLAFARQDARPVGDLFNQLPRRPADSQWLNFLRNLDELDMERLSQDERQDVYRAFAPSPDMRLYERGIRRRLAPMLGGDRRRLEQAFSLLFSLPGAPLVVYGDEIGMGDDLSRIERESVRTPMQWSGGPNGGFSSAARAALSAKPIDDGPFGYPQVNVADQRRDPNSLLHFVRRLIQCRKDSPEVGIGSGDVVEADDSAVFAYTYQADGHTLVTVHNLAHESREARLRTSLKGKVNLRLNDGRSRPSEREPTRVRLAGDGYCWYRVG